MLSFITAIQSKQGDEMEAGEGVHIETSFPRKLWGRENANGSFKVVFSKAFSVGQTLFPLKSMSVLSTFENLTINTHAEKDLGFKALSEISHMGFMELSIYLTRSTRAGF